MSLMTLYSPAFKHDDTLPVRFTRDGLNISPPLTWRRPPRQARTLACVMLAGDPGGPRIAHWLFYNFSPFFPDGMGEGALPPRAVMGLNDSGSATYDGPGIHTRTGYDFVLYPLDVELQQKKVLSWPEVEAAMQGHVIAQPAVLRAYYPVAFAGIRTDG